MVIINIDIDGIQIQTAPEPNAGSEEVVLKRDAHGGGVVLWCSLSNK